MNIHTTAAHIVSSYNYSIYLTGPYYWRELLNIDTPIHTVVPVGELEFVWKLQLDWRGPRPASKALSQVMVNFNQIAISFEFQLANITTAWMSVFDNFPIKASLNIHTHTHIAPAPQRRIFDEANKTH